MKYAEPTFDFSSIRKGDNINVGIKSDFLRDQIVFQINANIDKSILKNLTDEELFNIKTLIENELESRNKEHK
jgi:hypothetical protein